MNIAPDHEPAVPGLALKVSDGEFERLRGRWVAADDQGEVRAEGANFDDVAASLRAKGSAPALVELSFNSKPCVRG